MTGHQAAGPSLVVVYNDARWPIMDGHVLRHMLGHVLRRAVRRVQTCVPSVFRHVLDMCLDLCLDVHLDTEGGPALMWRILSHDRPITMPWGAYHGLTFPASDGPLTVHDIP